MDSDERLLMDPKEKLLLEIKEEVPPKVHLLSHIAEYCRQSIRETSPWVSFHPHLDYAFKNAWDILNPQNKRDLMNSYLSFLQDFKNTYSSSDSKPPVQDLQKLYSKTKEFIEVFSNEKEGGNKCEK